MVADPVQRDSRRWSALPARAMRSTSSSSAAAVTSAPAPGPLDHQRLLAIAAAVDRDAIVGPAAAATADGPRQARRPDAGMPCARVSTSKPADRNAELPPSRYACWQAPTQRRIQ